MLHLYAGPELRSHYWLDREDKKKAQHLMGFEPTTSRALLHRRVLYRCALTAALDSINMIRPLYTDSKAVLLMNLSNIENKFLGTQRVKPGADG